MLKLPAYILAALTLVLAVSPAQAQIPVNDEWKGAYGPYKQGEYSTLPREMTPEERRLWDLKRPTPVPSVAPPPPARHVAEFERMQGVLIRYPLGISTQVVREMAQDAIVYTIVSSEAVHIDAFNTFMGNGVNMANVQFIVAPTDSIYTRDYGPWGIFEGTDGSAIVDFTYNRPRPNDDQIPGKVSAYLSLPMFTMGLIHSGGNFMSDGMGVAASTDLVVSENPDKTVNDIGQSVKDFLGVATYHIVPDPTGTYIQHIDTWGKFLGIDKLLLRQVPPSHPQFAATEATATYFANQTSSFGKPYKIYRVSTPNDEPYTNALILNNKVLVPIMGTASDAAAIAAYQAAMPGYQVIGFTGSWLSTDALHCRVMGIPDAQMLYIQHFPPVSAQQIGQPIEIRATVVPYSGQTLTINSPVVYWKGALAANYVPLIMAAVSATEYQAFIPPQTAPGEIYYYIHADDNSGKSENHPFIGASDPHVIMIAGGGGLPAPPSNLIATAVSTTQVNLVWTDNANNETGFKIERRTGPRGSFDPIATVRSDTQSYSDSSVTSGQQYFYRVRATNPSGDSAYSNVADAQP